MEQNQNPQPPVFEQQPQGSQYETYIPMMSFWKAVKTCFKKYFDFKGRARRSEYWWFTLFIAIVSIVWSFLAIFISIAVIFASGGSSFNETILLAIMLIPLLFLFIPQYAACTRRLHDTGHSGWWVVLSLIIGIAYTAAFIKALLPMWDQVEESGRAVSQFQVIHDTLQTSPALGVTICLLLLASTVVGITMLVFQIMDSHRGVNKYGPSPKYQ